VRCRSRSFCSSGENNATQVPEHTRKPVKTMVYSRPKYIYNVVHTTPRLRRTSPRTSVTCQGVSHQPHFHGHLPMTSHPESGLQGSSVHHSVYRALPFSMLMIGIYIFSDMHKLGQITCKGFPGDTSAVPHFIASGYYTRCMKECF
jgi:hypothetical protein